jgi:hypothetical protein
LARRRRKWRPPERGAANDSGSPAANRGAGTQQERCDCQCAEARTDVSSGGIPNVKYVGDTVHRITRVIQDLYRLAELLAEGLADKL